MNQAQRDRHFAELKQELADNGVHLSRDQRRAMAKVKKHKPRIVRTSKTGGLNVIARRIVLGEPMQPEKRTGAMVDYFAAIDAMTSGRADLPHFDVLVYACNVAQLLCEIGLGEEHHDLVVPATAGMRRCSERYDRIGKLGLDAEALQALRDMADLHEAQLEAATHGEIEAALREMNRRVAENKRSERELEGVCQP